MLCRIDWPAREKVPEESLKDPKIAAGQGYSESKWVAERILDIANQSTTSEHVVVRVGQLCGSRASGSWNVLEWFPALVQSQKLVGCLPNLENVCRHNLEASYMKLTKLSGCKLGTDRRGRASHRGYARVPSSIHASRSSPSNSLVKRHPTNRPQVGHCHRIVQGLVRDGARISHCGPGRQSNVRCDEREPCAAFDRLFRFGSRRRYRRRNGGSHGSGIRHDENARNLQDHGQSHSIGRYRCRKVAEILGPEGCSPIPAIAVLNCL